MGKRVTVTHNKNGTVTTRTTYSRKTLSGKTKSETFVKTSKGKKGCCYVATAVYGSYDCPEVWTLRRYRDSYLLERPLGRLFVKLYYAVSPKFIAIFGKTKWFNRFFRARLDRFVSKLRDKGYSDQPYYDR